MNRVLRHPADLARQLGVTLPSTAETNGQTPHTTPVVTGMPEPVDLSGYPEVAAAVDRDTGDRSEDTMRVVGACYDNGLTLDQTRWVVGSRTNLAQRLAGRHDDDVLTCWLKVVNERQNRIWMGGVIGNPSGEPWGTVGGSDGAGGTSDPMESAIQQRMNRLRADREAKRRLDDEDRPPTVWPVFKRLDTLLAEPDAPICYRIEAVAPADSRIILSAQYKAGKTTLVANLLRSLVDGDPFLGCFTVHTPAQRIILIDDEMGETMLRRWLREQGAHNTTAAGVFDLRGKLSTFNLLDDRCRAWWAQQLRDQGCDYLVLDCLRPVLDALGLDENRDAGKFLIAYDALLDEAGITDSTLVQHMGHANERARGDSRLQDWPAAIWRLVRESENSPRYFSAVGRDVDVREGRLNFDPATRRLTYVAGSRSDAKTEAAKLAVITLLASSDPMSKNAIETELKSEHTQKAVRAAIGQAVEDATVDVTEGPRGAKLHSIAYPCAGCGMPVATQAERHLSCPDGAAQ